MAEQAATPTPATAPTPAPTVQTEKPGTQLDRALFTSQRDYEDAVLDNIFAEESDTEEVEQAQDQPAPQKQDAEEPAVEEPEKDKAKSQEEQTSEESEAEGTEWTPPVKLAELADQLQVPVDTLMGMKVDTPEGELTVAEAIRGTLREADYTRKTMDLSEKRKAHEAAVQQAQTHWSQRFQELNETAAALSQLAPQITEEQIRDAANPNSPNFDPQRAFLLREQQLQWNQALGQIKAANQRQLDAHKGQMLEQEKAFRAEQDRQLLQALPELADAKTRDGFKSALNTGLVEHYRFTPEEVSQWLNSPYDHRFFPIVKDALEMQALRKGKKETAKAVKAIPKIVKAGAPKKPDVKEKKTTALDRLKRARTPGQAKAAEMAFLDSLLGD